MTAQLDGERALKPKLAPLDVQENFSKIFGQDTEKPYSDFEVSCIEPNKDIYYFYGQVVFGDGEQTKKEKLDLSTFLHRGTIIRNSGKVLGLVVYTGTDTKLIMNFGKYKFKKPEFELLLNKIMYIQFGFFILSVVILAIGNAIWNSKNYDRHSYIFPGQTDLADANDIKGMTKKINGGFIGLEDREKRYKAVLALF